MENQKSEEQSSIQKKQRKPVENSVTRINKDQKINENNNHKEASSKSIFDRSPPGGLQLKNEDTISSAEEEEITTGLARNTQPIIWRDPRSI
eukprot:UN33700